MIYSINQQQLSDLLKGQNIPQGTSLIEKGSFNAARLALLQNLVKDGVLEGILLQKETSLYLQTKEGLAFPVSLQGNVPLGKFLKFFSEITPDGKILLTASEQETAPLVEQTLKTLGLPKSEDMKKIVQHFMKEQLPLDRTQLLQSYTLAKQTQLPLEIFSRFLQKNGEISKEESKMMVNLKEEGLTSLLQKTLQLGNSLETPQAKIQLFTAILKEMTPEVLEKFQQTQQIPQTSHKNLQSSTTFLMPKELSQINLSHEDKVTELVHLLNQEKQLFSEIEKPAFLRTLRQLFETFLKPTPSETQTTQNLKILHEESLFATTRKFEKIIKSFENLSFNDAQKEMFKGINDTLIGLNKWNTDANYYLFPMWQQKELKQGEVYFFKPKKKSKKEGQELYAVVNLDMSTLNHLEIHIRKIHKDLNLTFYVENEAIQKFLQGQISTFNEQVTALGYHIVNCQYALISLEDISIKELLAEESMFGEMKGLDFKV